MSADRAHQIVAKLDQLTQELKDLADYEGKARISDIRTDMGFEKGGYVGRKTLDNLLENECFNGEDDNEEEEADD